MAAEFHFKISKRNYMCLSFPQIFEKQLVMIVNIEKFEHI